MVHNMWKDPMYRCLYNAVSMSDLLIPVSIWATYWSPWVYERLTDPREYERLTDPREYERLTDPREYMSDLLIPVSIRATYWSL